MVRYSPLVLAAVMSAAAGAAEVQTFTVRTLPAQMRFDVTDLAVEPGQPVKILFENGDDLPHNMVFFKPETDPVAVANKQMETPEAALKREWVPDGPAVWLHSKMLNPKEKQEFEFKAPDKPGVYPFACTFPGHTTTMQGKLNVSAGGPTLTELKFALYLGNWARVPDFSKLKAHREGDVVSNKIEIKLEDYKNEFGLVFNGKLQAPKAGEYSFFLASDDGSRLLVDGKLVVGSDGVHPSGDIRTAKVKLTAGEHELRLEYFQSTGDSEIYLAWRGPGFDITPLSSWLHPKWKGQSGPQKDENSGIVLAVADEPVIYRNFVGGAGVRGIAVGYPGGVSLAWNAERMNLATIWRGAFIDAARHWNGRGGGFQLPLGYDILQPAVADAPPFAVLASPEAPWPKMEKTRRAEGYQWKGYRLDSKRFPTFNYVWNGLKIADTFAVTKTADGTAALVRTLKLTGAIPEGTRFLAASGTIKPEAAGFAVDAGDLTVEGHKFKNAFNVAVQGARVAGSNLVVEARPEITLTYSWPAPYSPKAQ